MAPRLGIALSSLLLLLATPAHAGKNKTMPVAGTYVVKTGDTLWDIAQGAGCRVGDVRAANDLPDNAMLRPGDELDLPRCGGEEPTARVHVVASGDTLSGIALKYKTTVDDLVRRNALSNTMIVVGQRLTVGEVGTTLPLRVVKGQSVGRPQRGKLVDGVRLPYDAGYYRRRKDRAYGAQHVVDHTRRVIDAVRTKYPKLHRLAIGDLSDKNGGKISGHASHQSGRDVDLGLYFEKQPDGYPQEFVRANDDLHRGATWQLVLELHRASKKPGGPQKVFLDYRVQGKLYEHAKKRGVSKKVLGEIFQYPDGRWAKERFVKHEPMHADHLHVRFSCPTGDDDCH